MDFEAGEFMSVVLENSTVGSLLACNDYTSGYGLTLSESQAVQLDAARRDSLRANGRIEFGGGAVEKLIRAFCDSRYISSSDEFASVLGELVEIFYAYKNETFDALTDDELVEQMKTAFEGVCRGSVELLPRELEKLGRSLLGLDVDDITEITEEDDDD